MRKNQKKNLLVVVPMKDLREAKSRLNDTLNGKERELLAKLLFLKLNGSFIILILMSLIQLKLR